MYPRRDDGSGLYGYWAREGWAIAPRFEFARHFLSGYAAVDLGDERCGLIDKGGTLHALESICGGRTPVGEDYSFSGFIDWNEEPSRHAAVCTVEGRRRHWGLIDTSLDYRPFPDEVFSTATRVVPFGRYLVVVRKNRRREADLCGLFSLDEMRMVIPCEYSCIYTPKGAEKGAILVVARPMRDTHDKRDRAFFDLDTREIVSDWFFGALPFSHGLGAICEREQGGPGWYFVDTNLRPAFDAEFDGVDRFSHGLAGVYQDSDAGYIDTAGRMRLLLPHYDELQPFNAFGLAIANRDDSEWDLDIIDRTGRPLVSGLETAVFWEGDFPYFEVSKGGEDQQIDMHMQRIV